MKFFQLITLLQETHFCRHKTRRTKKISRSTHINENTLDIDKNNGIIPNVRDLVT